MAEEEEEEGEEGGGGGNSKKRTLQLMPTGICSSVCVCACVCIHIHCTLYVHVCVLGLEGERKNVLGIEWLLSVCVCVYECV